MKAKNSLALNQVSRGEVIEKVLKLQTLTVGLYGHFSNVNGIKDN